MFMSYAQDKVSLIQVFTQFLVKYQRKNTVTDRSGKIPFRKLSSVTRSVDEVMKSCLAVNFVRKLLVERTVHKRTHIDRKSSYIGRHLFHNTDDVIQIDLPLQVHGVPSVNVNPRSGEHLHDVCHSFSKLQLRENDSSQLCLVLTIA